MPHIIVWNLAKKDYEEDRIKAIEDALIEAVTGVTELKLTAKDISFSFPQDPTITSDQVPVVIIMELLFEIGGRPVNLRQKLATEIGIAFRRTINGWRKLALLEVAVKRFDPRKDGFFSSK